jgi:hypothetical protein
MKTRIFVKHKTLGHFINIETLGCEGEEEPRKGLRVAKSFFDAKVKE